MYTSITGTTTTIAASTTTITTTTTAPLTLVCDSLLKSTEEDMRRYCHLVALLIRLALGVSLEL